MNDDLVATLETLAGATVVAQGIAYAACHTVREMLVDVARMHPAPESYIKDLFERVSGRLDPLSYMGGKDAQGMARDQIAAMFRDALETLQSKPPGIPPSGGRRRD